MTPEERAELYRQDFCQAHNDAGKDEIDAMVSCLADDFKITAAEAEAAREADCLAVVQLSAELAQHPNDSPEADAVRDRSDVQWAKIPEFVKAVSVAAERIEAAMKDRYRPLVESASAYVEYEISDDPETAHGAIKPMCDALAAIRALE